MKNSKQLIWIAVAICMSCSNVKETPKGFQFTVLRQGDGIQAKPGEFLIMDMVFKDGKDSVWNDTRKGDPLFAMIQDTSKMRMEDGIDEIFRMLTNGDSITFKIPATALFEKTFRQPLPKKVDPKSEFTFNMVVKDHCDRAKAMSIRDSLMAIQTVKFAEERKVALAKLLVENRTQLIMDGDRIDAYLKKNKIQAKVDSSGIRYVVALEGTGPKPALSQSVVVNYLGKVMETGVEFDRSKSPVTMPLLRLIPGWQLGFPLLSTGSKATFYVPSSLAYGEKGSGPAIPANANLIFEVELVGIK